MTDIEKLILHMQRVKAYLASAEATLTANVGTEAAKISAASITIGAAHSSFTDLTKLLSECGGSIETTVARIEAIQRDCVERCQCGMDHSPAGETANCDTADQAASIDASGCGCGGGCGCGVDHPPAGETENRDPADPTI